MRKRRKDLKKHQSPLTAGDDDIIQNNTAIDNENNNKETMKRNKRSRPNNSKKKKSTKVAKKEAEEDFEEQNLTNLIFGIGGDSGGGEDDDDYLNEKNQQQENAIDDEKKEEENFSFQIDRIGVRSDGDDDNDDEKDSKDEEDVRDSQQQEQDDADDVKSNDDDDDDDEDAPAWEDPDDDDVKVSLVESSNRLKKLRKSRLETKALSSSELEERLRDRYQQSTQTAARTDWATTNADGQQKQQQINEEDRQASNLFSTSSSLLASSIHRLPPNILSIVRCPDANQSDPNKAVVQAVNFHPASDPDRPLMLTAGLDKTLRFFQVGEESSQKIHGIHFPKLPIYSANFLGSTGNVVVSGRRSFFYIYDAVAGKVDFVPKILGREEKSWERHTVSPDGRLIAFVGNDGYVVLVDSHSKYWIADLKLNGSVRAIAFTPDGKYIVASGSDGDIYRWDVNSRKCIERFSNYDGTITSCLAVSSKTLAVGAESGVVNLYSEHASTHSPKTAMKSIMNLHTSADSVRFNHDGQILAMSTKREQDGLKLLHVPTKTVFSNWPTSKTPLKYVWSMDFSPQSRFFAIGNDKGKCLLYKLNHYSED